MNIRPMTADDLKAWWKGADLPRTVRGFVAEHDGRIMGVSGLMYLPHRIIAFAEMVDEGQQYPLTIMRMARKMKALMDEVSVPIFAEPDGQFPNSRRFLEHVGFKPVQWPLCVYMKEGR
jgi:hypothetical protein